MDPGADSLTAALLLILTQLAVCQGMGYVDCNVNAVCSCHSVPEQQQHVKVTGLQDTLC